MGKSARLKDPPWSDISKKQWDHLWSGEAALKKYGESVPHVLHLPESARKLLEAYLQLADWNQLRRLGEGHSNPLNWETSPEIVECQAKQPLPTAPPTHTSQLIIDLLLPSEVVLMEELDSIKKILDPKTPIVWLKEILSSELWEEELFQRGDVPLPPGLQTTWNQLSHHLGNYHQIPEATTRS